MGRWDPRAVIVLILALAVSAAHLIAVIAVARTGRPISEVGGDVLIALVGAIIAIIAGYVASYTAKAIKEDDHDDDQPPPPS